MRRLLHYMRALRLRYAFGIFCTLVTTTLAMAVPIFMRAAVNAIEAGRADRLARLSALICAAAALIGVARWFSRFVIFNCGRDIEYALRNDLFEHLTTLDAAFYQRIRTGDLMSRLINDLTAVRLMVGMGVLTFTAVPFYYVYALAIMTSLEPWLMLASVLPYVVLFAGMRRLTHRLMDRSLRVQEELGAIAAQVQESLAGIHVLKGYTVEEHDAERFERLNERYNEQGLALARVRGGLTPLIRAASAASTMVVLIYGGWLVTEQRLSLGDLVAFMGYLSLLAWPTTSLGWMLSIYQRGKAAMKRLNEIFEARPAVAPENGAAHLEVSGAVEWERVCFSYFARGDGAGAAPYALHDVNVSVPAGGKLAIVGRTGSGKSTMIKLLARVIDPTAGRVLLDGRDVRELPLGALRRTVGLVPQEPVLFSDTIARNIAFGSPGAEADDIEAAARTAGLTGDIAAMPRGYATAVGERGMALSGGQKQRLTIARLLTYDPAVVVLDDALSSVDTETERAILTSLGERVRGRTTIVVSHRVSAVRDADQIIVLDRGTVVERGTHEELMARRGLYAELFRRQLLEEELARY